MTSRLDRLLLLLDTGSSTSVRNTAAKQLAQLAVKSIISDVTVSVAEDVKNTRQHGSFRDPAAWGELMAVVARIIPYLHSKSHETRTAASVALSQVFSSTPVWQPLYSDEDSTMKTEDSSFSAPEFTTFSVEELVVQGKLLLASSGKEFIRPVVLSSPVEVKKARKEAMGRLGLEFLDDVAEEMDLDKELGADIEGNADVDMDIKAEDSTPSESPMDVCPPTINKKEEPAHSRSATPADPSPVPTTPAAETEVNAMSARERNRLKRKRKPGNSAFVAPQPPPQASSSKYNATATGTSKARLVTTDESTTSTSRLGSPTGPSHDKVMVDPSKGGAVSPKAVQEAKALSVKPGCWIWDGVVQVLEVDLFSAAWEVRHGAALALRELLKIQGKCGGMEDSASWEENLIAHEKWCNDLSAKLLCVLVLDRFGDFVSDQVVAPVREMISQTLASLLIHMPQRSVLHVHSLLLQMIRQEFVIPAPALPLPKLKGSRKKVDLEQKVTHIWEIRHAGLLGIKYEVAVRSDLFDSVQDEGKQEDGSGGTSGATILSDVVDAAVLGLGDKDDDVRAVAASCLLPVAGHLVERVPESLDRVLLVLWSCLSDMKDDLSSSVGAVMELLGKLVAYDKVIEILANDTVSLPLATLAPTLFPFFRHTIYNVRLSVVKTLHSFMTVESLPRDWISVPFLRLLYQNMIVEERLEIRDASLEAWRTTIGIISDIPGWMESNLTQQLILDWYAIVMTPLGLPVDPVAFYHPVLVVEGEAPLERHNVDKNMLAQDLSLITTEVIIKARIAGSIALALLITYWPSSIASMEEVFQPILLHYVDSTSMLQKVLSAIISEEWAREYSLKVRPDSPLLIDTSDLAKEISNKTLAWLQGTPPAAYHEMAFALARIHVDAVSLLHSFAMDCKLPISSIPFLGSEIDITGTNPDRFTIETAQEAIGPRYNQLKSMLGRTKKRELAVIEEKRVVVSASIDRYLEVKNQHEIRVGAAFAAAFVALRSTPDKVSPVVKGIMNGIKNEENLDLQTRSAVAVAAFIEFCSVHQISQPPDKIVKNLCTFLCQDVEQTPTFAFTRKVTDGILSFHKAGQVSTAATTKIAKDKSELPTEETDKSPLSRRGARLAFDELSSKFGGRLLDVIPNMWQSMAGGLLSAFQSATPQECDAAMEKQFGQDVIDSLSVLEAAVPTFHLELWPKVTEMFPMMLLALRSKFAIIRQSAARCFATICEVITADAMRFVIEQVVSLMGDTLILANRQGATELVYHIVQKLDIKALPYVIFLVIPVLGRMSDANEDVRATATNTFASVVKMIPLEAGLPDPPGFPEELLKRREEERQFLTQLLDGSKVEQYTIPVPINAELRKYQQDGVNWLAFLAKYQLHGILCDDMGLGKTLQSICILSSKHFERTERYKETNSPDAVHLPSLIICPPTLTGHWYYEILKYADNLKPVMYTGNARERAKLVPKFKSYDIVITSYEVVRNDINNLESMRWLYCILDEGHVIKNAKTKLTKAVKSIQAQHRLILSGTPIQNNVLELWSLFDFLMPGFLGTESSFSDRFSKPILANRDGKSKNGEAAALALEALHKQVLPFLLRRLKEDVLNDLPPKIIQDYYCDLSDLQKTLYDDFSKSSGRQDAEDAVQNSASSSSSANKEGSQQHIFQSLQYLRKLCNHPALVLKDQEAINNALEKVGKRSEGLSDIQHAPKLLALRQLLLDCGIGGGSSSPTADQAKSELIESTNTDTGDSPTPSNTFSQHRVLIFCQMKQMLNIIERDLFRAHMPSVTYMRLDGGTDTGKRHAIVQTFNADPSIDVLLLTTHVGGLGLTLTGADTVIFVEHDWNPMKDLQAMDRAHRIGQKKVVNVYRLITKGTLEEKIMGLQRFKLNVANSVVTQQNSGLSSMDTDLVLDLFKRTSEGGEEEEEEAGGGGAKKKKKKNKHKVGMGGTGKEGGSVGQQNLLQGLEDLPPEDEYQEFDMSKFLGSIGK
ncbi:SNF2 chromatin remodeling protein [Lentinula detonsa]|uniref:TATA-binding protein-associated factor mot1 n=1 Tax=Lentinula detonsa TaxID=2804962 RepID=A0A9W8TV26_9AGAR|nr:SNF2 chromatin remodeling protein [Lentinula detonsa]